MKVLDINLGHRLDKGNNGKESLNEMIARYALENDYIYTCDIDNSFKDYLMIHNKAYELTDSFTLNKNVFIKLTQFELQDNKNDINDIVKIEQAGNAYYNGINCRLRTALKSSDNNTYYLEISTGHNFYKKNDKTEYIVINFLFKLNNPIEKNNNYSKELNDITDYYHKNKQDYTLENIKALLNKLNIKYTYINFNDKDYRVHAKTSNTYNLGN